MLFRLPENKKQQIIQITSIIKEVVSPEKIILFGSYATGNWVEDEYFENGIRYSYISDYDFLVVTNGTEEKEHILNDKIINKARSVTNIAVNCIIHDIDYINEGLSFGQYFFSDIVREGIVLHDTGNVQFTTPKELTPAEQKEKAQNYFDIWFNRGSGFLKGVNFYADQGELKIAAFTLHQATECFYNTILLVFTGYKPKTHSLEKLRQYAKPYSKELAAIFPERTEDKQESHLFDLLKRGYIDARYKNDYFITATELSALIAKVQSMKSVIEEECRFKMKNY